MAADLVVAFDTASEHIALAVGRLVDKGDDKGDRPLCHPLCHIELLAEDNHAAMRQANVLLMPSVDSLFRDNGLSKADVACVVCGLGPGSFTGVRIGVATAKGMARGLGVPLYGVSTLDAVAWETWVSGLRGRIGVIADAMRGEVYPARFDLGDQGVVRLDSHAVTKAEVIAQQWVDAGEQLLLLGDGLGKFAASFPFELAQKELWTPSGRGLLLAFEAACASGTQGSGEAGVVLPVYTRLSDAEENERKRLASGGQIAQGALVEVPRSGVADPAQLEAVTYRPMASVDLEQVSVLEALSFSGGSAVSGERWSQEMFADELARKDRTWWVAYAGEVLVGFAGGLIVSGALEILDVSVAPTHRRRGIAQALLARVVQDGIDLGAQSATLEVRESNAAAQALYVALGFAKLGTRPDYYAPLEGAQREAAVIMEKQLGDRTTDEGGVHDKGSVGQKGRYDSSHFSVKSGTNRTVPFVPPTPCHAPLILAIETSCDETAAAVIDGNGTLLADTVASQVDFHARFGGVVPEIASRKHTEAIVGVVDAALEEAGLSNWQQLDALAVTYAPGLIGALVVGVAFAKGLSWATDLPLIRVNHLEGHIYANRFADNKDRMGTVQHDKRDRPPCHAEPSPFCPEPTPCHAPIEPPFVIALLSGGHTMLVHARAWGDYRILGQTLDDAVGEAFDKTAKALGLGYPGGPVISKLATQGDPRAIDFPRALLHSHDYRFSLSGLKTAVITYIKAEQAVGRPLNLPNIAASFQQAVIDVQVAKALMALEETGCTTFCIGGGVAANRALRDAYCQAMDSKGFNVVLPPNSACTDNAAMIALVALDRYNKKNFMSLADDAFAQSDLEKPY
ncbi:MAG: tRNA (adenosine(37)-N6)-threonylcarbamoyltransferase complex dimerization subunit type 1 TsaB [Coriobacteriia bacterium]|nr:tRNA (adenosine(37)-N6)-threonylcarbamoyltransferase complex dimerization subunit type 1 TsaB [Coriobacteriia bacterium]